MAEMTEFESRLLMELSGTQEEVRRLASISQGIVVVLESIREVIFKIKQVIGQDAN